MIRFQFEASSDDMVLEIQLPGFFFRPIATGPEVGSVGVLAPVCGLQLPSESVPGMRNGGQPPLPKIGQ
jgi:hypothetical protein